MLRGKGCCPVGGLIDHAQPKARQRKLERKRLAVVIAEPSCRFNRLNCVAADVGPSRSVPC